MPGIRLWTLSGIAGGGGILGIEPLRKWIEKKEYLRAVTIWYSAEKVKGQGIDADSYNASVDGSIERSYHPHWRTERVYQCLRGISVHNGNPSACGRMCLKAKSEDGDDYIDRDVLRTLIVTKSTIFNSVS
jgi:BTB/POZ domain-containing protein KCTD9